MVLPTTSRRGSVKRIGYNDTKAYANIGAKKEKAWKGEARCPVHKATYLIIGSSWDQVRLDVRNLVNSHIDEYNRENPDNKK